MTRIRLIADDLTGALDASAQFTGHVADMPVLLTTGRERAHGDQLASAAICTDSRDLDRASAIRAMSCGAPFLAEADIAFVKIDSLLRGNWPAGLAALLAAYPDHTCIFAPAFPAQRRTMRDGRQYAPTIGGGDAPVTVSAREALEAAGLRARIVPRGGRPVADGARVLICDAVEQADIDALVAAELAMGGSLFWCGSAGLARALAGSEPLAIKLEPVPPLIVIGSCHPITLAQLAAVPDAAAARVFLGPDAGRSADQIERLLVTTPCIVTVDLPSGLSAMEAMRLIEQRLKATLPRLAPVRNLVVIGGETLSAVCRAVSAKALLIEGELLPGVPCSRLDGGIWDGVHLISRSGAFGGPGFLVDLLAATAATGA